MPRTRQRIYSHNWRVRKARIMLGNQKGIPSLKMWTQGAEKVDPKAIKLSWTYIEESSMSRLLRIWRRIRTIVSQASSGRTILNSSQKSRSGSNRKILRGSCHRLLWPSISRSFSEKIFEILWLRAKTRILKRRRMPTGGVEATAPSLKEWRRSS